MHTSAAQAAGIAQQAGVKQLILTHISARYEAAGGSRLPEVLVEAKAMFPNTLLAYDLWTYSNPT